MKKNYFISAALLLGAVALVAPTANAQGWRNMNHLLPSVARSNGWSGVVTGGDGARGVAEIFAGAGKVYQIVRDLPAGEYTLTANAFYRDGAPVASCERHFAGTESHDGYIFANDTEVAVKSLFDKEGVTKADILPSTGYVWGVVPNDVAAAADAFVSGEYLNTLKVNHPGGDMIIGYVCKGNPKTLDYTKQMIGGDETEAWSIFSNFQLKNAAGENIPLAGDGKFDMANDSGWHTESALGQNKGRGFQAGGVYSKTNASVYDHSVTIPELPAGKYRFSIQSFNQHYLGAHPGYFIAMKQNDDFFVHEGKSAYDLYKENATEYPRGQVNGANLVSGTISVDKIHAYLYAYNGEKFEMKNMWDGDTETNYWFAGVDMDGVHYDGVKDICSLAIENKIKNLFEEDHDQYLEIQNYKLPNGSWKYVDANGNPSWFESGHMREVAAAFVADPNLYKNTIEFELPAASPVTIGYHKDVNQNNYAHPVFDFKLEYYDPSYKGYDVNGGSGVSEIMFDENAPVEYFNLQGVRVANPSNGIFIVKQGNKVTKRVIR